MPQADIKAGRIAASDKSRAGQSGATGIAVEHCRAWLIWAAVQVDACLANDNLASGQMLAALADALDPAQTRSGAALAPASDAAGGQMAAVVIAVQAHDRVMQGLTHVADSLRALHSLLGDAERADSAESWRMLREAQIRAFSMAQERALFARMVTHEGESTHEADIDPEETVELFTIEPGLHEP
jgi:hypothetical protein